MDITKTQPKTSITQRLQTDLGRSVGVTTVIQLVWLNLSTNRKSCVIKRNIRNDDFSEKSLPGAPQIVLSLYLRNIEYVKIDIFYLRKVEAKMFLILLYNFGSGFRPCGFWNCMDVYPKAKEKYRGVFEFQRSVDKTSSGEIGLDIRTHVIPKVGQDQVSGGVSVLCWHAASVAYVLWKHCTIGKNSNSVIRSRSVTVKNWCNVLSMEGVTVCGHHPECHVTFGRGGPHIVW